MDDKAKYRLCETADCTIITGIEDIEIPVYIASSEKVRHAQDGALSRVCREASQLGRRNLPARRETRRGRLMPKRKPCNPKPKG